MVCGDTLAQRKPHPEPLREVARQLASPPVIYVGDSEVDAQAAAAAEFSFFLYTEGFRLEPVNSLVFAESFQDFQELPAKVETFFAAL